MKKIFAIILTAISVSQLHSTCEEKLSTNISIPTGTYNAVIVKGLGLASTDKNIARIGQYRIVLTTEDRPEKIKVTEFNIILEKNIEIQNGIYDAFIGKEFTNKFNKYIKIATIDGDPLILVEKIID